MAESTSYSTKTVGENYQPTIPNPSTIPDDSPLDSITQELFDYLAREHNVLLIDPNKPIGRGAFAVVYKAVKLPEREICAAKCMFLEVAEHRLRTELQMLSLFRYAQCGIFWLISGMKFISSF